jgi:hypothetical protein
MKNLIFGAFSALVVGLFSPPVSAAVVYDNAFNPQGTGSCAFECLGTGHFAAQAFTLVSTTTIQSASFTALVQPAPGTVSVDWIFLSANGLVPGTQIASGSSSILSVTDLGPWSTNPAYTYAKEAFNVGSVTLGPGTYFFAIHGNDSPGGYSDYLAQGIASSGAASSANGGASWSVGYESFPSIAVSLSGDSIASAVPEPATWAMMTLGFAGVGWMAYRRRKSALA